MSAIACSVMRSGSARKCESGGTTPLTPSLVEHGRGRRLEEVVPDDVAREQPVGLRRRAPPRRPSSSTSSWSRTPSRAPRRRSTRSCSASIRSRVLVAEPPGRVQVLRGGDVLLLLLGDPGELRGRGSLTFEARRRQRVATAAAVGARLCRDRRDLAPCSCRTRSCFDVAAHDWISSPKKTSTDDEDDDQRPAAAGAASARGRPAGAAPPVAAAAARGADAPDSTVTPARPSPARPRRSRTRCRRRGGSMRRPNLPRSFARERTSPRQRSRTEGVLGRPRARSDPRTLPAAAAARAPAGWATSGSRATSGTVSTSR